MEKITMYKCSYCGELFRVEEQCLKHETKEKNIIEANEMLQNNITLGEINRKCHLWEELPPYLDKVTKDNCFVISHWQCCEKPAYQIQEINIGGDLYLSGVGSWYGAYGGFVNPKSHHLKKVFPKEDLYIFR